MKMENTDSLVGRLIDEKFEIIEKIGAGGEAAVYKAYQRNLERTVALKIINESMKDNQEFVEKFIREAKHLAGIEHENVVRIYDYGRDGDLFYIVMELLVGVTLDKAIAMSEGMSPDLIIRYISPIADALQTIHDKKLIHRDIKSSNIFITEQGRPVLMDFGIAHSANKTVSLYDLRATPQYMSPEHAAGNKLDGRSDLYSLGVVMYECLTGNVPFVGEDITTIIHKVINEKPVIPPLASKNYPKWLQALVLSLLSKNPDDRVNSAKEVCEILRNQSNTNIPKKISLPKRQYAVIGILAAISALVLVAVILWLSSGRKGDSEAVSGVKMDDSQVNILLQQADQLYAAKNFELSHKFYMRLANEQPGSESISDKLALCVKNLKDSLFADEFVTIPESTFLMGSEDGGTDEKPIHAVELSAFSISKHEITNKQFCIFLNAFDCHSDGYIKKARVFNSEISHAIHFENGQFTQEQELADFPVFGVTWTGAQMFCREFGGRLPTEAEWEYVARGKQSPEVIMADEDAWYTINSSGKAHPVGCKNPNSFGIYDMFGNVWEWCSDNYQRSYTAAVSKNPTGPVKSPTKVIRGGDFNSPSGILRVSYRSNADIEGNTGDFIGFRMVVP
jgi:serine/threonine protein kinase